MIFLRSEPLVGSPAEADGWPLREGYDTVIRLYSPSANNKINLP